MNKIVATALACALVAGCATNPKDISPSYVSPVLYQGLTCDQLRAEAEGVSQRVAVAYGQQKSQQTKDAVATTVGLVIFWPSLFFIGGDKSPAGDVARLKGEMLAIEQANTAKQCGITFQQ